MSYGKRKDPELTITTLPGRCMATLSLAHYLLRVVVVICCNIPTNYVRAETDKQAVAYQKLKRLGLARASGK